MIHMYVLFKLTAIFPKSKMAAVSHIGYVPIFKNHQICIEMTTRSHSDHFWIPLIAYHVAADGHLENDKMTELPYSSDQSCPNEGFRMPKWDIFAFDWNLTRDWNLHFLETNSRLKGGWKWLSVQLINYNFGCLNISINNMWNPFGLTDVSLYAGTRSSTCF